MTSRFIVIVVVLLIIAESGLAIASLQTYDFVANAQSSNSAEIFFPSNMNKMEITLKNDQSANPSSTFENPLLIALISGLTAILGGIMGSYMTNRSNREMEDKKYERERKREKEREGTDEKKNEDYKNRVITSTFSELKDISFWLGDMQKGERPKGYPNTIKAVFQTIRMEYLEIPYDTRIRLFSPFVQYVVESVYRMFQAYTIVLMSLLDEYKLHPTEPFAVAVNKSAPTAKTTKMLVDIAIHELEKLVPKDVLETFREEEEASSDSK